MDSTARGSAYNAGLDTSCGSAPSVQGYTTQSPHALGRKFPIHDPHKGPATTFIGGILDSPLVQISQRSAGIPLSPPPTQPTRPALLPPIIGTPRFSPLAFEISASNGRNDDNDGHSKHGLEQLITPSTYSPPLSPVGTSPSFTSLALSLPPVTLRHRSGNLSTTPSPPSSHHQTINRCSPDSSKILLSPLSPEWGTELVGDDGDDPPSSIDAILSTGLGLQEGSAAHGGHELDDLGLGDEEDGSEAFAFAGFLNRSSRPRLSMLEIPPSAFPTTTLSPSSYYPSASSATPALWTVEETPTSPSSSSLWKIEEALESLEAHDQGEGCDRVTSYPSAADLPTPTSATTPLPSQGSLVEKSYRDNADVADSSSPLSRLGSSSPSIRTLDLFDDCDENSFDAYLSPHLQYSSLPSLLSSPHMQLHNLPEEDSQFYGKLHLENGAVMPGLLEDHGSALLLSSGADFERKPSPVGPFIAGAEADGVFTSKEEAANQDEYSHLSRLLGQLQTEERDARAKENEALATIASIRPPRISSSQSPPSLHPMLEDPTMPTSPPLAVHSSPSSTPASMSLSELQAVASDSRRTAKKARTKAKEVSALLKLKARTWSSHASLMAPSPSPPMLFGPLDDTTTSVSSIVSPPFPTLHMDFATSPPIFSSTSKALAGKSSGGDVHHLVAKMILNRREAGSSAASHSPAVAHSKPVFLSPLLGHHHQLQLQQRYKFLRSSPLARNMVTIASPRAPPSSTPQPLFSSSLLDYISSSESGPLRSNSLDSTSSCDTACSSMSGWDSDGETSLGDEDDLPEPDDEDAEMGFQALKTPLTWGLDLGFDDTQEVKNGTFGDEGGDGLLPAL